MTRFAAVSPEIGEPSPRLGLLVTLLVLVLGACGAGEKEERR